MDLIKYKKDGIFMQRMVPTIIDRLRVLTGHYCCPDCYRDICDDTCGKRHQEELDIISHAIGKEEFDYARALIEDLSKKIKEPQEQDPELTRLRACIIFMEGDD